MTTRQLAAGAILAVSIAANEGTVSAAKAPKPVSVRRFDSLADAALAAMTARAAELKITGVAVVAYAQGDTIKGWTSKMEVVGRMTDAPTAADAGHNLLAIAYAKAAQMADTLQDSGTAKRPPMVGEFAWEGGVIARVKTGYAIVAFSGASSEQDVEVSRAGLAVLKAAL
jgi:hypothetical protein